MSSFPFPVRAQARAKTLTQSHSSPSFFLPPPSRSLRIANRSITVYQRTMAAAEDLEEESVASIYRVSRSIKRNQNSLYNALRSIYEDSIFVAEIAGLWSVLPLVANLRCGLWYSPRFEATCYFKSTDGHANNWSFSTSRLNLHLALLAGTSP